MWIAATEYDRTDDMTGSGVNWDRIASWWRGEVDADPVYREDIAPLVDRLIVDESGPILDLGCGEGQWMRWLDGRAEMIVGCDQSLDLLSSAARQHPAVRCELPGLTWLRSATIATAYSVFVLDLIEGFDAFFREAARVVKPNGALIVVINHPVFTAPDSGPFMDPDLEVFWRWGRYFDRGATPVPAGVATVIMYHRPFAELLTSAALAGWAVEEVIEAPLGSSAIEREPSYTGQEAIPRFLGVRWRRQLKTTARSVDG